MITVIGQLWLNRRPVWGIVFSVIIKYVVLKTNLLFYLRLKLEV